MSLVFDPIAGVGKALVAMPTYVGLVLGVAPNVLPHVFQRAAGLAAEIAAVLARKRIRVPALGPNLADTEDVQGRQSSWMVVLCLQKICKIKTKTDQFLG
jgi:hypothetical protein